MPEPNRAQSKTFHDYKPPSTSTSSPSPSPSASKPAPNPNPSFDTAVTNCPSTRRTPAIRAHEYIEKPGVARGNLAVSTNRPYGDTEHMKRYRGYTSLQQHVLFWDRDADGMIYPWDTYIGFRELGFNVLFSLLAVLVINLNFSYPTRLAYSVVPDPWFRVYIGSIHKAMHGSDSGTYDTEGRFVPQQFENMFSQYDGDSDGAVTINELFQMVKGHRRLADPFGWGAAFFEWGTTWLLIQKEGKVYKEDLRAVFDGSMFWHIREERRKSADGWNKVFGVG